MCRRIRARCIRHQRIQIHRDRARRPADICAVDRAARSPAHEAEILALVCACIRTGRSDPHHIAGAQVLLAGLGGVVVAVLGQGGRDRLEGIDIVGHLDRDSQRTVDPQVGRILSNHLHLTGAGSHLIALARAFRGPVRTRVILSRQINGQLWIGQREKRWAGFQEGLQIGIRRASAGIGINLARPESCGRVGRFQFSGNADVLTCRQRHGRIHRDMIIGCHAHLIGAGIAIERPVVINHITRAQIIHGFAAAIAAGISTYPRLCLGMHLVGRQNAPRSRSAGAIFQLALELFALLGSSSFLRGELLVSNERVHCH